MTRRGLPPAGHISSELFDDKETRLFRFVDILKGRPMLLMCDSCADTAVPRWRWR